MTNLLLISESPELARHIADSINSEIAVIGGPEVPAGPAQVFQQLGPGTPIPQVVAIDTTDRVDESLGLTSRFAADYPGTSMILLSEQPDAFALAALRAGACDVVHPRTPPEQLGPVLHRALQLATTAHQQPVPGDPTMAGNSDARGKVISVLSPKGGVGKTTVATNLAVGLARTAPLSTVLVDLDVQFGDVASALNMHPDHSLLDVTRGPAVQDSMVLKTFLTQHETGLYAVCGPANPADADSITPEDVTRLIKTLAAEFRYVVVDTAPGLDEHALAALDLTNDLVLMTSLDVPGVRGLRKELDIIRDLGAQFDGRQIVLNFADTHSGLTKSDVEATIGTSVNLILPRSRAAAASVNQGVPLLQSDVRDPMTKQLRKLVSAYAPAPVPNGSPHGAATMAGARRHGAHPTAGQNGAPMPGTVTPNGTIAPNGSAGPAKARLFSLPGLRSGRSDEPIPEGGRHRFLRKRVQG